MASSLDRQRDELRRAERLAAVGRISAQITHEIRNPLNAIGLNAELLAEELERRRLRPRRPGSSCAAISREVDRLNGVAEEYLTLRAAAPARARPPGPQRDGGRASSTSSRPELQAAGVEVVRELAPEALAIRGDEGQLRAVFLNLLRNSREAMPAGGRVTVRTRRAGEAVEAEVADTGGGIPPEVPDAHLRAVLLDEGAWYRARARLRAAGGEGARRDDPLRQRGGPGDDVHARASRREDERAEGGGGTMRHDQDRAAADDAEDGGGAGDGRAPRRLGRGRARRPPERAARGDLARAGAPLRDDRALRARRLAPRDRRP